MACSGLCVTSISVTGKLRTGSGRAGRADSTTLNIGRQVFTSGLADPDLWTNQLYTVDLGVNWYWTQFIKLYLGWQHAGFGNPVLFAPEPYAVYQRPVLAPISDLLLMRTYPEHLRPPKAKSSSLSWTRPFDYDQKAVSV